MNMPVIGKGVRHANHGAPDLQDTGDNLTHNLALGVLRKLQAPMGTAPSVDGDVGALLNALALHLQQRG